MKLLLFKMAIVSVVIISTLNSCKKDESVPGPTPPTYYPPITLNLTADQWQSAGSGVFVNTFKNVIPAEIANPWVKVYLVTPSNNNTEIDHPITFEGGAL